MIDCDNDKTELEDQFILRLPHQEAEYVRSLLRRKPKKLKKRLSIDLNTETGTGTVVVRRKLLEARLRKLPSITDSYKTYDGVYLLKTADVCHVLDCVDNKNGNSDLPHGLNPPLKNVKKKRFRKRLINKDEAAVNVQKELFYLLQADLDAVSTKFEIITCSDGQEEPKTAHRSEIELFGNVLTDSEETDSDDMNA